MPIEESPVPTPVQMIALLAGLQIPQALYVVAKLGVATALADGPGPGRPAASGSDRPPSAKTRAACTRPGSSRTAPTRTPSLSPSPPSAREASVALIGVGTAHLGKFGIIIQNNPWFFAPEGGDPLHAVRLMAGGRSAARAAVAAMVTGRFTQRLKEMG
jgi:hypothetical protein